MRLAGSCFTCEQMQPAASVDDYLAKLPADQRAALETLRGQIRAAAPEIEARLETPTSRPPASPRPARSTMWRSTA